MRSVTDEGPVSLDAPRNICLEPSELQQPNGIHSVSALAYRLITGPLTLEPLQILNCETGEWHDWTIELYILGASHAMVLKRGRSQVSELLTCGPAFNPSGLVAESNLNQSSNLSVSVRGLIFSVDLEIGPIGDFEKLSAELPPERRMEHAFYAPDGAQSWTRLGWTCDNNLLRLGTLHTYPQEGLCVRSSTVVTGAEPSEGSRRYGR